MDLLKLKNELASIGKRLAELSQTIASMPLIVSEDAARFETEANADEVACLRCGLPIPEGVKPNRGNHHKCYRATLREIESGEYTEEDAVEAGLLEPARKPGRKPKPTEIEVLDRVREVKRLREEKAKPDLR